VHSDTGRAYSSNSPEYPNRRQLSPLYDFSKSIQIKKFQMKSKVLSLAAFIFLLLTTYSYEDNILGVSDLVLALANLVNQKLLLTGTLVGDRADMSVQVLAVCVCRGKAGPTSDGKLFLWHVHVLKRLGGSSGSQTRYRRGLLVEVQKLRLQRHFPADFWERPLLLAWSLIIGNWNCRSVSRWKRCVFELF